jgi:hypothetical protein
MPLNVITLARHKPNDNNVTALSARVAIIVCNLIKSKLFTILGCIFQFTIEVNMKKP